MFHELVKDFCAEKEKLFVRKMICFVTRQEKYFFFVGGAGRGGGENTGLVSRYTLCWRYKMFVC